MKTNVKKKNQIEKNRNIIEETSQQARKKCMKKKKFSAPRTEARPATANDTTPMKSCYT